MLAEIGIENYEPNRVRHKNPLIAEEELSGINLIKTIDENNNSNKQLTYSSACK